MMNTILNLGLNDSATKGLAAATENERFAYDAYRRLINMFGDVVVGVHHEHFEDCLLYTSPSPRDRTRSRMPSSA